MSQSIIGPGIDHDSSYAEIVAFTDYDSYEINVEKIQCTVKNNNPGKGFYVYQLPFIEYYNNGIWQRMYYEPPELGHANWFVCGEERNSAIAFKTSLVFYPRYVKNELPAGQYRLVVFVGKKIVCAPFEFVSNRSNSSIREGL